MDTDPIVALRSLGYTERESAFLYLVAVHSGYFLRRQFDYFIDRNKGALVMRFLEKARTAAHIESLDYRQGWQVYHLYSRTIYRLFGNPDSQLRRRKGDGQVRARLMAIDYVLENDGHHYLESDEQRLCFFSDDRSIPPELFTNDDGRLLPLLAASPISIADRSRPAHSPVRFAFIDEGLATVEKFLRFLAVADSLLRAVGNFEVVYIAASDFNFADARDTFWSRFSGALPRSPRLFDDDDGPIAAQPRAQLQPRFTTLLLDYSYPRIQRSEPRGSIEGSHARR
ncbi:MAG: hypothetical protein WBY53_00960 [Acidobacteriaceae bacterium]